MPGILFWVLFLFLALLIPGYLIVGWFTKQRGLRHNLETIEAAFLSLVLSASITGLVALALAQAGNFSLPVLLGLLLVISLCLASVQLLRRKSLLWQVNPSPKVEWLALFSLIVAAGALFLHPHEFVYGAADAGVYVNLGANLDKTGALLIDEPLLKEIEPRLLPGLLREQPPRATTRFIRLPGFYLSETVPGRIIPQFFPLHPVWLGIGHSLFDLQGNLFVTPFWAILGVVAVYLCGRALFNGPTGYLSGLLLLMTPLQIYFARYPTAEPITQFFSWAFILSFSMYARGHSPRGLWGLAAGTTFGQVFLARIDASPLLLIPALWITVLVWRRQWQAADWWFWIPAVGLSGYALFHGLVFSAPYTLDTYSWLIPFLWRQFGVLLMVGAVGGLLSFYLFGHQRLRINPPLQQLPWKPIVRCGAAVTLVGLGVYAYFIRPHLGSINLAAYWYASSQIPITNHENLVRLGWYLSPLGIGLALAGGVLFLLRERWSRLWPLWTIGGGFTVVYIYNIFNNPYHIYAMRRYVPIVVPFFVLAGAYFIFWLWQYAVPQRAGRVVGTALLIVLVGMLVYNDRLIWKQVDYQGAIPQIADLADHFEEQAIVLFVDDRPVGLGAILGTPLQFLYGITSFDLQESELDIRLLRAQIGHWLEKGHPVFVARDLNSPTELFDECLVLVDTARIDTPRLETSYDHPPSEVQQVQFSARIFQVMPACAVGW